MKRLFLLLLAVCSITIGMSAATQTVRGQVIYAGDNEPIIGASVLPVGGGNGTSTDHEGAFELTLPESVKFINISYVGMTTKQVSVQPNMVIRLENSDTQLSEVVVTAMGMKKERKALGYAAQDLKSDDLNTDGTTSLASAIQGKLTGVDIRQSSGMPGASSQIVIRGARSFSGNNQPLYVVDGLPIESTADFSTGQSVKGANISDRSIDINPEDIESINVLKGQAASALYGIRASNGVVLITTKRGKLNSNKPQVTISANISAERLSRKFQRQDVYSQGNYFMRNDDGTVVGYNPSASQTWGPKISELANDVNYGGNTMNKYTATSGLMNGQYYNPKRELAGIGGWDTPQIYDNVGDFFGTGFTENSSFNLSQKKDNLNYSFGINNSYQKGVIPSTGMNRWNARGLVDWEINSELKTGFSVNYSSSKITSAPGGNTGIVNVVYSAPSEYDLKGIPATVAGDPSQQILFRTASFMNPYWWADNSEYLQHTNRAFGNAYMEYRPKINWGDNFDLTIREQVGLDTYTSNYSDVTDIYSDAYLNATNSPIKNAVGSVGEIENYGVSRNVFNNLLTANFNATFGDNREWDFSAMVGNEVNQDNTRKWDYYGYGFNYYGFPTISNATNFTSEEYNTSSRTVGFFGQLSLAWRTQLYLTLTGRNDYVSTMPRGNRSFFYPSASLGWIFTELPALKNNDILSFGKLRGSLAQVGQAGQYYNNYYYVPTYGSGMYTNTPVSYPVNGVSSYVPYYVEYDPNLKPQNTTNVEFGADLRFFRNRLSLEYTWSYQNVTDQIFSVPMAGSTGYQYLMTNGGKMRTMSHELSLNVAILEGKDYSLDFGTNFTHNRNEVIELAPGVESIFLGGFAEPQIRAQAGCTYPNIYGVGFKRDTETGKLLLKNGLVQGTSESINLGDCTPDFNMGFNLGGRYKRVSLATTWSLQWGGKMYHGTNMVMNYFGATKESLPFHEGTMIVDGIDEVTGQQNTIEVDRQDYYQSYYDVTESGIYDTSFLKLRDLTLTYQCPRIGSFDISVFGFARNVLIWSKLPNFDPESSQGNGNMGGYFERFSVPSTSSFGAGFKVSF